MPCASRCSATCASGAEKPSHQSAASTLLGATCSWHLYRQPEPARYRLDEYADRWKREYVQVATKVGLVVSDAGVTVDLSPKRIVAQLAQSLERRGSARGVRAGPGHAH